MKITDHCTGTYEKRKKRKIETCDRLGCEILCLLDIKTKSPPTARQAVNPALHQEDPILKHGKTNILKLKSDCPMLYTITVTVQPVRLGNTRKLTDYAQKSPQYTGQGVHFSHASDC